MQFFKSSEKDGGSRPSRRSATNGGLRQYLNTKSSPAILVEEADIPLTESSTVRAIAKVAAGRRQSVIRGWSAGKLEKRESLLNREREVEDAVLQKAVRRIQARFRGRAQRMKNALLARQEILDAKDPKNWSLAWPESYNPNPFASLPARKWVEVMVDLSGMEMSGHYRVELEVYLKSRVEFPDLPATPFARTEEVDVETEGECAACTFKSKFRFEFVPEEEQMLKWSVRRRNEKMNMEHVVCIYEMPLLSLAVAPGQTVVFPFTEFPNANKIPCPGFIRIRVSDMQTRRLVMRTHLRINDLRAVGFWSTKPNPFVVLSRLKDDVDLGNRKHNAHVEDSADWKHLAHSKTCPRNSHPEFSPTALDLQEMYDISPDAVRLAAYTVPSPEAETGAARLMGLVECRLHDLVAGPENLSLPVTLQGSPAGTVSLYSPTSLHQVSHICLLLRAGLKIRCIFGVDYAFAGFQHPLCHIQRLGGDSYTGRGLHQAFTAMDPLVQPDDHFHVMGFGAQLFGEGKQVFGLLAHNCSQCYSNSDFAMGYQQAEKYILPLKRTNYAEMIRAALSLPEERTRYKVLVMFTPGGPFDWQETLDAIVEASKAPMSIFFLGLHDERSSGSLYERLRALDRSLRHTPHVASGNERAARSVARFFQYPSDHMESEHVTDINVQMMRAAVRDMEEYYELFDIDAFPGSTVDVKDFLINGKDYSTLGGAPSPLTTSVGESSGAVSQSIKEIPEAQEAQDQPSPSGLKLQLLDSHNDRLVNSHPKDRLEYLMKLSLQSINHVPSDAQMSRPASQAGTPGHAIARSMNSIIPMTKEEFDLRDSVMLRSAECEEGIESCVSSDSVLQFFESKSDLGAEICSNTAAAVTSSTTYHLSVPREAKLPNADKAVFGNLVPDMSK